LKRISQLREDDKPPIDTLTLPRDGELRENRLYRYWLKLSDIALERAREEQRKIKRAIQPQIDRYRRIRRKRAKNAA
jgi:hypothetical protein